MNKLLILNIFELQCLNTDIFIGVLTDKLYNLGTLEDFDLTLILNNKCRMAKKFCFFQIQRNLYIHRTAHYLALGGSGFYLYRTRAIISVGSVKIARNLFYFFTLRCQS